MTTEQALDTAFDNMPEKFTANKFCEEIKKLGLDNDIISSGIANRYYSKRVKKITKRLFIKKPQFINQTTPIRKEFNMIRLFRLEWVKSSGGGIEDVYAETTLEALEKFYRYWGDPHNRIVYKVELIDTYYSNKDQINP